MELRKEVELNERKLRSFPQYITQLNPKGMHKPKPHSWWQRGDMQPSP